MYKKFLNVQWFPNFNKGQTQKVPVTPIYGNGALKGGYPIIFASNVFHTSHLMKLIPFQPMPAYTLSIIATS